jgi:hypothetical protein
VSGRYLTDLFDVLAPVVPVIVQPGWETRARASGGYADGQPSTIVIHHTASSSGADPDGDLAYITTGATYAPISNLYLSRSGTCYVVAAGATNHAGSGGPGWGMPLDGANSRSIGIEAANNGTGEPWPTVQQDAYVAIVQALCDAYGIAHDNVISHAMWAPTRKIDPFGPSRFGQGTWDIAKFRAELTDPTQPPEWPKPGNTLTADDIEWIQNALFDTLVLFEATQQP